MSIEKLKDAFLLLLTAVTFLLFLGWFFVRIIYRDELIELQDNLGLMYPVIYNGGMFVLSFVFAILCYRDIVKHKEESGREVYRIILFSMSVFIFGYGLFVAIIKNA